MVEPFYDTDSGGRRQFRRFLLNRPCSVIYMGHALTGRLRDISLGGAGLTLPNPATSYTGLEGTIRFRLPDLCNLKAEVRWRADRRIGVEFEPAARESANLRQLLRDLAAVQEESRDTTTVTSGFLPTSD